MRRLPGLMIVAALGLCLAGAARAELLRWEGTLALDFVQQGYGSRPLVGGGFATVNGSGGLGHLNTLRIGGGIAGAATVGVTDPGLAPLRTVHQYLSLGTGVLGPISGGVSAAPMTQRTLPIRGDLKLCFFFATCAAYMPVPLTVGGTRGAGVGGPLITVNTYGPGIHISVSGAPWTIGVATAFTGTTLNGAPTAATVRSGFAHGPVSGTTSTANLGGVVRLVTPIQFTSTFEGFERLGFFAVLRIAFVPEPSTALLLGAGVAGLAMVGRPAKRRRR